MADPREALEPNELIGNALYAGEVLTREEATDATMDVLLAIAEAGGRILLPSGRPALEAKLAEALRSLAFPDEVRLDVIARITLDAIFGEEAREE